MQNVGNGVLRYNYATDFKVQDERGKVYNPIPLPGDQSIYEKLLYPGEKYRSIIAFDVPNESSWMTVIFRPLQVEGEIRRNVDPY